MATYGRNGVAGVRKPESKQKSRCEGGVFSNLGFVGCINLALIKRAYLKLT